MRLWTLHPEYLDTAGLGALWREGLGARVSLAGRLAGDLSVGYSMHPALNRFAWSRQPTDALENYLCEVVADAHRRGYAYDTSKLRVPSRLKFPLPVSRGQVAYEIALLRSKLAERRGGLGAGDDARRRALPERPQDARLNPIFWMVAGDVEPWERPRADVLAAAVGVASV